MEKPTTEVHEYYPYQQCAEYVGHLLGIEDLRDVDGKFRRNSDVTSGNAESKEYRDFWHFLMDRQEIHNGCVINIHSEMKEGAEDWQQKIIDAFVSSFGEDAEYWVYW